MFFCWRRRFNPKRYTKSKELRKQLLELISATEELDKRFVSKVHAPARWPRPLPEKVVLLLVRLLQRGRLLNQGILCSLENHSYIPAALCTRAHFETTGALAHCLHRLKSMKAGNITRDAAEETIDRLLGGSRWEPDGKASRVKFEPINVLKTIDSVDELIPKITQKRHAIFREWYDFLSEFCHPNFLGTSIESHPAKDHSYFELNRMAKLADHEIGIVVTHASMSNTWFTEFYDRTWAFLRDSGQSLPDTEA